MIVPDGDKSVRRRHVKADALARTEAPKADECKVTLSEKYDIWTAKRAGEPNSKLGVKYDVSEKAIYRYNLTIEEIIEKDGVEALEKAVAKETEEIKKAQTEHDLLKVNINEFGRKARSILWMQDKGKDRVTYDLWQSLVKKMTDAGLSKQQAMVQASKGFLCLSKLFTEYDTSCSDPDPDYCPIRTDGEVSRAEIACDNKEQTHRENLVWAIEASGKFLRTGQVPGSAPNDSAYFLFRLACDEPKDFLAKYTQVDIRGGDSQEEQATLRSGMKSIGEIDDMLSTLKNRREEE